MKANPYFWRSYREKPVEGIGFRDAPLTEPYPRNDDTKQCIIILIITTAIIIIVIANNNTNSVVSSNFISLINTKGWQWNKVLKLKKKKPKPTSKKYNKINALKYYSKSLQKKKKGPRLKWEKARILWERYCETEWC